MEKFITKLSTLLFTTVILMGQQTSAQMCTTPGSVIYGLSSNGNIVPITVTNASVGTTINSTSWTGSGGASANALGYNTVNGKFYYFQNNSSGGQQFMCYNPTTNSYTLLANSPISNTVNRGCVSFDGTGYYCLDQNSNLCYYNIAANTWTLITKNFTDQYGNNVTTTFSSQGSGDMAIDGLGNLWIVSSNSNTWGLYKISAPLPTTVWASLNIKQLLAPTTATPSGTNFAGIAFNPTGEIYMSTNNDLYLLSTANTLSHIGAFSTSGVGSDITSCNFPFSILPVSWQSFSATLQNNKAVSLSWEVSQQVNDKGYYVEQSTDGTNWNDLGFVANSNNGKSTDLYSFVDNNPANGKNYYRIKEVDLDGAANYSEIKAVAVTSDSKISVWPNPAKDVISIQNNNAVYSTARIYNQSGSLISENKIHDGNNSINVSSLSFGAYIISLKNANGESYNQKFIKE